MDFFIKYLRETIIKKEDLFHFEDANNRIYFQIGEPANEKLAEYYKLLKII